MKKMASNKLTTVKLKLPISPKVTSKRMIVRITSDVYADLELYAKLYLEGTKLDLKPEEIAAVMIRDYLQRDKDFQTAKTSSWESDVTDSPSENAPEKVV